MLKVDFTKAAESKAINTSAVFFRSRLSFDHSNTTMDVGAGQYSDNHMICEMFTISLHLPHQGELLSGDFSSACYGMKPLGNTFWLHLRRRVHLQVRPKLGFDVAAIFEEQEQPFLDRRE
jgi:hypothetical protein